MKAGYFFNFTIKLYCIHSKYKKCALAFTNKCIITTMVQTCVGTTQKPYLLTLITQVLEKITRGPLKAIDYVIS